MKEFDEKKKSKKIEKKLQTSLSRDEIINKAFHYHLQGNIVKHQNTINFLLIKVLKIIEFF